VLVVALLTIVSLACLQSRRVRAYLFGRVGMVADAQDDRVFNEPATPEANTAQVLELLDESVATVERAHGRAFAGPVRVYICATQQSYNARTGDFEQGRARGAVFADCVFLSPRTFDTNTCREILTHELSHLHFRQHLGSAYTSGIPGWFQEGLAVYISDGGGAEPVSVHQARVSILSGVSMKPEDVGSRFPRMSSGHGLKHHMFYRQSAMFVEFFAKSRPDAFARLLEIGRAHV